MSHLETGSRLYKAVDGLFLDVMRKHDIPQQLVRRVGTVSLMDTSEDIDGLTRYRMLKLLPEYGGIDDVRLSFGVDFREGEDDIVPYDSKIVGQVFLEGGVLMRRRRIAGEDATASEASLYLLDHVLPSIGDVEQVDVGLTWDKRA